MGGDDRTPWDVMLLRFLGGLLLITIATLVQGYYLDTWLAFVGAQPDRLELEGLLVLYGWLFVVVSAVVVWSSMWKLRRAGGGLRQLRLLVASLVIVLGVGFLVTGCIGYAVSPHTPRSTQPQPTPTYPTMAPS